MSRKSKTPRESLVINSEVLRRIRQHARSQSKNEVCGVLIGREHDGRLEVSASIPGVNATQGGTHVTFTQDTWEHIYKVKDKDYPDERILGWYHSHPGFGVFLSDHDTFIHKNFFSSPQQVAWVYDPHSDEEGCFGWVGGSLQRLSQVAIADSRGGEEAGETGKPEPTGFAVDVEEEDIKISNSSPREEMQREPEWLRWTTIGLCGLVLFAAGFFVSSFLFPQHVAVPVVLTQDPQTGKVVAIDPQTRRVFDPQTGTIIGVLPDDAALKDGGQHQAIQSLPAPPVAGSNSSTDSASSEKKGQDAKQR